MNRTLVTALGLALAAAVPVASAQTYEPAHSAPGYSTQVDFARVLRVDPVFDQYSAQPVNGAPRCYERPTYVEGGYDGYNDGYGGDGYRNDPRYDNFGGASNRPSRSTEGGRTAATLVGGLVGAVLGSKVGGGSARYATSALGSMVGGMAGRSIYEQAKRNQEPPRSGMVRVCDPVPQHDGRAYPAGEQTVSGYDVTYEYAGKTYRTRTDHHPGDRIRVRVDVRPD